MPPSLQDSLLITLDTNLSRQSVEGQVVNSPKQVQSLPPLLNHLMSGVKANLLDTPILVFNLLYSLWPLLCFGKAFTAVDPQVKW